MKINKWRVSLLIVLPITAILLIMLCTTLPIDQPKLFLRLLGATTIAIILSFINTHKVIKGC